MRVVREHRDDLVTRIRVLAALVTGLIAVIVYEKIGVRFLRTAWVNLDLLWAVALVITGTATALI
jgi:hypothetical protein